MSATSPQPLEPGLSHLERLTPSEIVAWLERALEGKEPLPVVTPGESPEGPILRWERSLEKLTRGDLREACHLLVRKYVASPERDSAYVQSLLALAVGFQLESVVPELHRLASDGALRLKLPPEQLKAVLSTLIDLRAPLARDFWLQLAELLPPQQKLFAMTGLLTCALEAAMDQLGKLPNDESVADALYVVLDQHRRHLNQTEAATMANAAKGRMQDCAEHIQVAVSDWLATVPDVDAPPVASSRLNNLDSGLAALSARYNKPFNFTPRSARLVAA